MLRRDRVRGLPGFQGDLFGQSLSFRVAIGLWTRLWDSDLYMRNIDRARPACCGEAFIPLLQELAAAEYKEERNSDSQVYTKASQESDGLAAREYRLGGDA